MIGPFYKGQTPVGALSILVKNSDGNPVDLSQYDAVQLRITDPMNYPVNLSAAVTQLTDNPGEFKFFWPGTGSVFAQVGDYTMQVALSKDGATDLTNIGEFEVHRQLGTVS